jgi:hypothetical protein
VSQGFPDSALPVDRPQDCVGEQPVGQSWFINRKIFPLSLHLYGVQTRFCCGHERGIRDEGIGEEDEVKVLRELSD